MRELARVLGFVLQLSGEIAYSRLIFVLIIATGVGGGLCNTGLLVLINTALNRRQAIGPGLQVVFLLLCILLPLLRLASRALLVHLAQSSLMELRVQLCRRVLATPLRRLEKLGSHRLYAILTDDVGAITNALQEVPLLFMHLTVLFGGLLYLGWLSMPGLFLLVVFIAIGGGGYQWALLRAVGHFERARDSRNGLFHHFRGLTRGMKELKIHRQRQQDFIARVKGTSDDLRHHNYRAEVVAAAGAGWGHMLFFVVVGLLILVLPAFRPMGQEALTGFTLVILYLVTPLQVILGALPSFGRAQVAIGRLDDLNSSLHESEGTRRELPSAATQESWCQLETSALTYRYSDDEESGSFALGPIELSLRRGEITFITGGNGSGKTTLAKLLVGLYPATSGHISVDGEAVLAGDLEAHREHFSAVFQDFFLFEELIAPDPSRLDSAARSFLERLGLEEKVTVEGGALSTVELSQGQRKRLALLTAYLEDRSIYVFDEWAADQDPLFKEIFYSELVPQLKKRGKTVWVISHDDRYFHTADRLLKLENGRVVADERTTVEAAARS